MASQFDRWEKDPFFSAAEQVQESADRMESTYRTWMHSKKDTSGYWNCDELRIDLHTALGTAKWQLEEFERAVNSSYINNAADDAKERHQNFISAIGNQISKVESSLNESAILQGKPPLPWVRLDEGECQELAVFLSSQSTVSSVDGYPGNQGSSEREKTQLKDLDEQSEHAYPRNSIHNIQWSQQETKEEKLSGHRRTASASASADISSLKILLADDSFLPSSCNVQADPPPQKTPSFSSFLNTMDIASKLKWSNNGYKKLKLTDRHIQFDATSPQSQNLAGGADLCYDRNKGCLEGCKNCCDKQLYGWYGAIQRQLQRSQYQIQYSRPVQLVFSAIVLLFLIVFLAMRTI